LGDEFVSLLLDSHALEWAFNGDPRLSPLARAAIAGEHAGSLFVSDITWVELARHLHTGKIPVIGEGLAWLRAAAAQVTTLPVTPEIACRAAGLDWSFQRKPHKDPADRLILATALAHHLPLVTKDEKMRQFGARAGLRMVW
jgi:PIN domain nuclease of toxin-antitoxin system